MEEPIAETPERTVETRRLADALRQVIERFVATTAPHDVFHGVADDLYRIADQLAAYPQGHLYSGVAEAANAGDPHAPLEHSPLLGHSHPLAPPLRLEVRDDHVVGTIRFGAAYEGPPGHVHGGYIAAIFDELLGVTQSLGGNPGMTGRLTIHYRSPTPLATDLRVEATLDRTAGRKTICTGRLYAGERLCAEAEGLFVAVDFSRIAALGEARDDGAR